MSWQFSHDVEPYARQAWVLLVARPEQHTVALTVVENVRAGRRWSPEPMLFGWWTEAGSVTGAVSLTPPFELLVTAVPDGALAELVAGLRARAGAVPGVNAERAAAERFAAAWTDGMPLATETAMEQRLYGLDQVLAPRTLPPGGPRLGRRRDVDLLAGWFADFAREAGGHRVDTRETVQARVDDDLLWLWTAPGGRPVSVAGRNRAVAGVSRVGPVYTPPAERRHGYGTAVTAACTQAALDTDARTVVLFTDLANPTSNAIYQQLGYRPLGDRVVLRFSATPDAAAP